MREKQAVKTKGRMERKQINLARVANSRGMIEQTQKTYGIVHHRERGTVNTPRKRDRYAEFRISGPGESKQEGRESWFKAVF